jgi:hypothetical protein
MNFFVKIDNARYVSFEGMSQEAIIAMFNQQNLAYEFVDELAYQEALESFAQAEASRTVGAEL